MAEIQKTIRSDFIRRPPSEIAGLSSRRLPPIIELPRLWRCYNGRPLHLLKQVAFGLRRRSVGRYEKRAAILPPGLSALFGTHRHLGLAVRQAAKRKSSTGLVASALPSSDTRLAVETAGFGSNASELITPPRMTAKAMINMVISPACAHTFPWSALASCRRERAAYLKAFTFDGAS